MIRPGATMSKDHELWERHVPDHLTAIKLALQLLGRRADLPEAERALARLALEATDNLAADLLWRRDGPEALTGSD